MNAYAIPSGCLAGNGLFPTRPPGTTLMLGARSCENGTTCGTSSPRCPVNTVLHSKMRSADRWGPSGVETYAMWPR